MIFIGKKGIIIYCRVVLRQHCLTQGFVAPTAVGGSFCNGLCCFKTLKAGVNTTVQGVKLKKIGVISDVHGNLPALKRALEYLKSTNCDEIIHTGDIVDIGAQSLECLQMLSENNVVCLMGNHDWDFVTGNARHKQFSHVSTAHKQFVFASLKGMEAVVEKFPLSVERICGGKKVIFEHYCRYPQPINGYFFRPIANNPSAEIFDEMYSDYNCDAVFFGHKHEPCDLTGKRLYVDVGSVGCHPQPVACGIVITYDDNSFSYSRFALPYDLKSVEDSMTKGNLPSGRYLFDFYFLHRKDLPFCEEEE